MAWYKTLDEKLHEATNAWLPDGYSFGLVLPHDTHLSADDPDFDTTDEDVTHLDRHSAIKLAEHRRDAMRYGQERPGTVTPADVTALPTTGRYIIVEISHTPTGIVAFRAYSYDTIRDLITGPGTVTQKMASIRNQLNTLYQTCQDRVAAAGGD